MKAMVESAGKVASKVRVGSHEVLFDQVASVPGGDDRGPSPLDVMAVAVAACAHYYAAAYLHGRGLSPANPRVEVEAEKVTVPGPRIGRLAMKVHLPAGLNDRQRTGVERAIKTCPAYGTLLYPPAVELLIDASGGVGTERPPA